MFFDPEEPQPEEDEEEKQKLLQAIQWIRTHCHNIVISQLGLLTTAGSVTKPHARVLRDHQSKYSLFIFNLGQIGFANVQKLVCDYGDVVGCGTEIVYHFKKPDALSNPAPCMEIPLNVPQPLLQPVVAEEEGESEYRCRKPVCGAHREAKNALAVLYSLSQEVYQEGEEKKQLHAMIGKPKLSLNPDGKLEVCVLRDSEIYTGDINPRDGEDVLQAVTSSSSSSSSASVTDGKLSLIRASVVTVMEDQDVVRCLSICNLCRSEPAWSSCQFELFVRDSSRPYYVLKVKNQLQHSLPHRLLQVIAAQVTGIRTRCITVDLDKAEFSATWYSHNVPVTGILMAQYKMGQRLVNDHFVPIPSTMQWTLDEHEEKLKPVTLVGHLKEFAEKPELAPYVRTGGMRFAHIKQGHKTRVIKKTRKVEPYSLKSNNSKRHK